MRGDCMALWGAWIARARQVLKECPALAYFWGSTCDGRRCLDNAGIGQRLEQLGWKPAFDGVTGSFEIPVRVLAFVAYLDDWAACGIQIASQLSRFAKGDPEELVTRELMLTLCVPGFAYNGATPGDRYYWPKFPYSDIVLLCQQGRFRVPAAALGKP